MESDGGQIRWLEVLRIPELSDRIHLESRRTRQGEGSARRPQIVRVSMGTRTRVSSPPILGSAANCGPSVVGRQKCPFPRANQHPLLSPPGGSRRGPTQESQQPSRHRHVVSKPTTIRSSRKPHCQIQANKHQTGPCADTAALFMSISAVLSLKARHTRTDLSQPCKHQSAPKIPHPVSC